MQVEVVGVKFRSSNNTYSFSPNKNELKKGDMVLVETDKGNDIGLVVTEKESVDVSTLIDSLKNVIRVATEKEVKDAEKNNEIAKGYLPEVVEIVKKMGLDMKVLSVESNFDMSRLTVNFTAEERVDFRALAKRLAEKYNKRVELRQVGPRDAVKILGGIGPCGKECCCSQGVGYCDHVSIKMAKNQNLSLNPNSISGLCGKLLCCLSYENENYVAENGLSGFSLTKKGWGCSLFSNQPWNGFAKGVKNIITDKTKKIVCINSENDFSHNLVDMYENLLGFSVCATTIDDEKIMREYYGNKFMNNFIKRQGKKPHHVFMIRSKTKPKEIKTFEDYFEAYEYVDKLEIK